ncbi:hypothetical protein ACUNWD_10805 [Sunxiuqinia sp. A32]|uniref:hypothetical protein n=1 Tax=Sunxiuqinia sp. A32 TaxID=3461496 RepID=UPI0040467E59
MKAIPPYRKPVPFGMIEILYGIIILMCGISMIPCVSKAIPLRTINILYRIK